MATDKPFIDMSPTRVLCSVHPLPWRETWDDAKTMADVIQFELRLFDALLEDEEFIQRCGGQPEAINNLMPIPLCCWVAAHYPDKLTEAYASVGAEPPDIAGIARGN
jgi:hypothetical protein